jgi:phenylalanyl-tRNA synthetase beta chain
MRLVVSWLRDWVDITASPLEIADTLALRGFEVASVDALPNHPAYPDQPEAAIDFEVTANRPDCLSVMGLAREVATAFDVPFAPTHVTNGAAVPTGSNDRLRIAIDDQDLGPRYVGAVMDVIDIPTPEWIRLRLQAAGVRPISAIVDVTNYVMIERGQPMHAFDHATLAGAEIHVRRAKNGDVIRTLDNVERTLTEEMLVIADRDRAQAVAGVMGGLNSEVSASTTTIVLESAYFKPASVRRTSKRLGLKTEASARFERGADINGALAAMQRAIALIDFIKAGKVSGPIIDRYPSPRHPLILHLRRTRLAALLGASVPDAEVERILRGLGLDVSSSADGWEVVAPTFRVDLVREIDLIEEVGRHYGLDKLPPTFPPLRHPAPPPDPRVGRDQLVRRALTAAGHSEAVTFGFIEAKAIEVFAGNPPSANSPNPTTAERPETPADPAIAAFHDVLTIANPLSAKFDTLRPSLLPGLVDAVAHNRRHGRRDVRLFEIGTGFTCTTERRSVAMAWTGGTGDHWSGGARDVDFFDVKGLVEQVCAILGVAVRTEPIVAPFLVPGQSAAVVVADGPERGASVGLIGQLSPSVADARGLPRQDRVMTAELNLDHLAKARTVASDAIVPLARYPFVVRDLSIVVADSLPAEIIRDTIQASGRDLPAPLASIGFFDRYKGKGVAEGAVSISVRLTFQAADRTLTDIEVQQSVEKILAALVREHRAAQR